MEPVQVLFNEALDTLDREMQRFVRLVTESSLPAQTQPPLPNPRQAAADIFRAFDYSDEQKPTEVVTLAGALAADEATLEQARRVNRAKEALMAAKRQFDGKSTLDTEERSVSLYRHHLNVNLRRARLNITQATRQILLLDQHPVAPRRLGLVMANADQKVFRRSWEYVYSLASRLADEAASGELRSILEGLPRDEMFAEVEEAANHLRVNIAWQLPDGSISRLQRRMAMPLLYPWAEGMPLPLMSGPSLGTKDRAPRLDKKISSLPLVPGVRIYRYLA